jgi:hypothetical protein
MLGEGMVPMNPMRTTKDSLVCLFRKSPLRRLAQGAAAREAGLVQAL